MQEIQKSIEETIGNSDLTSLGIDLSEVAIDAVMEDGILKDLPVVGAIVGLAKFGMNLKERILLKKIPVQP